MHRRQFIKTTALAALAASLAPSRLWAKQPDPLAQTYPFRLPPLPWPANALQPVLGPETLNLHHGKHHQAYVDKLNAALKNHPNLHRLPLPKLLNQLDRLPSDIRTTVRNNAGGHWNHMLYWQSLTPTPEDGFPPRLDALVQQQFGGWNNLRKELNSAGLKQFGSGWAWLLVRNGQLEVTTTPNQDNPLMAAPGQTPATVLLGLDVWEHAYYLDYQNRRGDYLEALWPHIRWSGVEQRLPR